MQKNIIEQITSISSQQRATQKNQTPKIIWLTGLSGAGKSSIANALDKELFNQGKHTYVLDGDNVRLGLCKDLGFGHLDRAENIRRIAEVARLFADAGLVVITAFISPFRADRELARDICGNYGFTEVYVKTELSECERRDPKGLYQKARLGEILNFTGIDSPYEEPQFPEITIDTKVMSIEEATNHIIEKLK